MHRLAPHQIAQNLRESNSRLIHLLDQVRHDPGSSPAEARSTTPVQMSRLLSELMHAGECLRAVPVERDPQLELELSAYRVNVERLRDLLPSIHSALLRERARLGQECARVEAAAEWASRSRQTL